MTNIEPDPYHELPANDRDHLLAAAWYASDHDTLPSGATVGDTVGALTGTTPGRNTTSRALGRLVDAGYIERVDGEPLGQARGVRVTDDGYRVLGRGAARLDAVVSVDAATALADVTGEDRERFAADDKDAPAFDDLESVGDYHE